MHIEQNKPLKSLNTFGLNVKAREFVSIRSEKDLIHVFDNYPEKEKFVLGGGSNMLLTKDLEALVLHLEIKGIKIDSGENDTAIVEAAAGENWHDLVLFCLENNLGGIENLSLIPGNVGTAPIQNIGAYGVELKDVFHSCRAYDVESGTFRTFLKDDCQFGYRNSIFKQTLKGKVVITSVKLILTTKNHRINSSYGAIQQALENSGVSNPSISDISEAVIKIRQSKLPDPAEIGNSGSFFKNPVITHSHFSDLAEQFPEIPSYRLENDQVKVPAGWLIEKAGFKGKRFGDYGVHDRQALVLVNHGNAKGKDILQLARLIQMTIKRIFDINLEPEVNIID
ncbi:MAG: UDP-N-acetylmuramate dehydrogenase [Flavobacteriaceae bacterium]|nr:UDP-N-acetylmuramate dehydrogenase [Flavobacteriaceae bacterium]